jgi:dihydropteroate synthase
MHMLGEPGDMQDNPHYLDVTREVGEFLAERMVQCEAAGIASDKIILDPGFGFAKTLQHNLSLFKHMDALHALGRPLLVGVSRKSMIGQALNRPVGERLYGGLALAALASHKGARILRVHDVAETVDVIRMIAAVESAE